MKLGLTIVPASLFVVTLAGCASRPSVTIRFHEQVSERLPTSRVQMVAVPKTGLTIPISPYPSLTGADLLGAQLESTSGGDAVRLRFDLHGAHLLEELTTRARGQYLVVFVENSPVTAVLVDRCITNGEFLLEGDFTDVQARNWTDAINHQARRPRDIGDRQHAP